MPQMGPLPWVMVSVITLSLVMIYSPVVYFSSLNLPTSGDLCMKSSIGYFWKW